MKLPILKILFVKIICLLGIVFCLPSILSDQLVEKMPRWLKDQQYNLGIDLQGGSQIVLEINFNENIKESTRQLLIEVRKFLRKNKIGYDNLKISNNKIYFSLKNDVYNKELDKLSMNNEITLDIKDSSKICVQYSHEYNKIKHKNIISQSMEIIEHRINELGTKEPRIQRQGKNRIIVQLPGCNNPKHMKKILGQTAKMTFHLVCDEEQNSTTKKIRKKNSTGFNTIKHTPLLSGENLLDAQAKVDEYFKPYVAFTFDSIGSKIFADVTRKNIGRQIAIVLDNEVISAPVIRDKISTGNGSITGKFTIEESAELALLMRSGSLPAPLKSMEEKTIGPSLGYDSIKKGKIAVVVSILFISVFMVLNYSYLGLVANAALFINLLLLMASMSVLKVTLTLAGIAGIALILGMAVDSNILIYERIKEEVRNGNTVHKSIEAGYKRAIVTILDSNITTLIGAFILFQFGHGSIKGFSVTLSLGIMISMFTSIFLTKTIIDTWLYSKKSIKIST
jgi:preprotein translocase subunit SecD